MAGRHSSAETSRSRAVPALLVLLAAGAIGVGGFMMVGTAGTDGPGASGCESTTKVTIAAAPEIAPVLETATTDLEGDKLAVKGTCIDYQVQAVAPEQVAEELSSAPAAPAQLWVPDFSVWVTRTALAGATPATLASSLATTPVVVVGPEAARPASWQEVGMSTVAYLDPLTSSASTVALLSAFGEMAVTGASEIEMGAMMVPLAQRYGGQPDKPKTIADVANAVAQGGLGVMTEQQLVALQKTGGAEGFTAAVPESGTMLLDYPLVALIPDEVAREAGNQLASHLAGTNGATLLEGNGFRNTQGEPLGADKGTGLGAVTALPAPDAQKTADALRRWSVLTVPSRMLAVIDVSGSMDFTDDQGRSRISLAIGAAAGALEFFPDNAEIGAWAFSVDRGAGNRDYVSLAPIRRLAGATGGVTHRQVLAAALRELPGMTQGGTGLYDTALEAVRTVQADYDAGAVNTVTLLTDGENDDPGSISLPELVRTLERERDPARPVPVIAIGMGPEADANALKKIASVTGGQSYIARDPADISAVFIDAMLRR